MIEPVTIFQQLFEVLNFNQKEMQISTNISCSFLPFNNCFGLNGFCDEIENKYCLKYIYISFID